MRLEILKIRGFTAIQELYITDLNGFDYSGGSLALSPFVLTFGSEMYLLSALANPGGASIGIYIA